MVKKLYNYESKRKTSFLVVILGGFVVFGQSNKTPVDYVDPFIGTSNSRWMLGPYATMPFGMVQLGPDNQGSNQGYNWMAGYEYAINSVDGFSHIHAWTMTGLRIMPTTADLVFADQPTDSPYKGAGAGPHSRILKNSEKASPGYYSVYLYDHDVQADMAVTTRCGLQRYTFPEKKESRILIDLLFPAEYNFNISNAKITKVSDTEIEGYALSHTGGFNDYKLCFVLQFDKPFQTMNTWVDSKLKRNNNEVSGKGNVGAFVTYSTKKGDQVHVRSGISLVSIEQARLNLKTEMEPFGWDIEAVKKNAHVIWNKRLSAIEVDGGTEDDKIKFYTNLYRVYAAKQTWNDVNGKYMDPCENERQLPKGIDIYGGDAFWNAFWNLNGLLSIVSPDITKNWVMTQLELFDRTGWTGKGPTGLEYSGIMEGSHEMALMLSAYQKGIYRENPEKLYQAMKKNVTVSGGDHICGGSTGNPGLDAYINFGYMPSDKGMTNKTLDYAYDDWCVAQMAKAIGNKKDYKYFLKRSKNYKNNFHPELKYVVPKDSKGQWKENYDPFDNDNLIEGNGWQYTLYVPHDIPGVVDMVGKDLFNERLEHGFDESKEHKYAAHALDRTGGQKSKYYINQGNQVNMQAAWLFNYSGKPWLTQKYTRDILETYYGDSPYHGWEGDEDEGQMGGWFVMSAIGLFEMNGGGDKNPVIDLSSPLFEKITIKLNKDYYRGKTFIIEAKKNSKENIYIQSAKLNGKEIKTFQIKFKDLVEGGKLELEMGPNPNKKCFIQNNF